MRYGPWVLRERTHRDLELHSGVKRNPFLQPLN